MSRWWRRRSGRDRGWTSTVDGWSSTAIVRRAELPAASSPSEGPLIRASILARLLGIRLLTLEADIAISPRPFRSVTQVDARRGTVIDVSRTGDSDGLAEASALLDHASRTLDETSVPSR